MRILFLTTVLPNNKKTGGEVVSNQYIKFLRKEYRVDVIGYKRKDDKLKLNNNEFIVDEIIIESKKSKLLSTYWLFNAILFKRAFSSQKYYSKKYIKLVKEKIKDNDYSLIIIDHSQLSWIVDILPQHIPIIFSSHNVEYLIYSELALKSNNFIKQMIYKRESKIIKDAERRLLKVSKRVWTLTNKDKSSFKQIYTEAQIDTIEVASGFKQLLTTKKQYDIGILGSWLWESNREGLNWFLQDVLPLIDTKYTIAIGGNGSLNYKGFYSNVNALGFVDDAQKFLINCKVIIIPTIAGGGIQIKTLDAISSNRPIVATSLAVRGLENLPKSIYIEDCPHKFAKKIVDILESDNKMDLDGFDWALKRYKSFKTSISVSLKKAIGI